MTKSLYTPAYRVFSFILFILISFHSKGQVTGFHFSPDTGCVGTTFGVTVTSNGPTLYHIDGQTIAAYGFSPSTTTLFKIKTPTPIYLSNLSIQSTNVANGNVTIPTNTQPGTYDGIIFAGPEFPEAELDDDYFGFGTKGEIFTWQCKNCFTIKGYLFYVDNDHDGYGSNDSMTVCAINANTPPTGYSLNNTDCNDSDNTVHPGAVEICDNKDNDCDGLTDEGDASFSWIAGPWSSCSVICGTGNQSRSVTCKNQIGQTVADCNCIQSEKPAISQSCFGSTPQSTWYQDSDNDTYGNPAIVQLSCNQPLGFVSNNEDCNDSDNTVHPGAAELCDNKDNDCDGSTDEGPCTTYSWTSGQWSTCSVTCGGGTQTRTVSCIDGFGNIVAGSLCDPNTQPSSIQSCNTNPCPTYSWSTSPWGPCSVTCGGGTQSRTVNCIDENGNIVAGSLCDPNTQPASSQNCTGTQGAQSYYLDSDSDGYGNPNLSIQACTAPTGYVSNNLDCNDANAGIHPGASDANCNGIDEDCDGIADDNYIAATCTACSGGVVVSTVTNVGITGLNTLNISSTSVKLAWDLNPLFESYSLDYRFSGGWISVNNIIGNMITLSNLTTNKIYEWRIRGKCAGGNLGKYTNSTFNTFAPCALAPTGLSATNITGNSATLNWNVVQGAISYTVQYLNSFTNTWTTLTTVNTNTYNWTGLSTRRVYSWRVSANCTANSSPFASSQFRTKNSLVELENRSVDITATVYPNPVKEKLNIVLTDGSLPEGITLFDAQGKMMLKYSKNITVVDMKPYGSGIYILQIKSGKKIENIKIFKE